MNSKVIKKIACDTNRILVKDFHTHCMKANFARILTCQKLYEMGIAPYDIGKILEIKVQRVVEYLDAYTNRMTTDWFFQTINKKFYNKINEYENTGRHGNNG